MEGHQEKQEKQETQEKQEKPDHQKKYNQKKQNQKEGQEEDRTCAFQAANSALFWSTSVGSSVARGPASPNSRGAARSRSGLRGAGANTLGTWMCFSSPCSSPTTTVSGQCGREDIMRRKSRPSPRWARLPTISCST
jgi:hypothetical protein